MADDKGNGNGNLSAKIAAVVEKEMEIIDSEVHHIAKQQADDRIDVRGWKEKFEERMAKVETGVSALGATVLHLDKSFSYWSKIFAVVIAGLAIAVITKLVIK